MNRCFIDSNILIYLSDIDELKKEVAESIILANPYINSQVLAEAANVCKRKFKFNKADLIILWNNILKDCLVVPTNHQSIQKAIQLVKRYDFQLFDALIVDSAINSNCTILYSKDMQHNLLIENQLTIINPFL